VFYYDYRNKQVRGKFDDPLFGALDELVNLPKSRIFGAEADITIRPVTGLTINGAVTYLDSAIQVGPAAPRNYNVLGQATNFSVIPCPSPRNGRATSTSSTEPGWRMAVRPSSASASTLAPKLTRCRGRAKSHMSPIPPPGQHCTLGSGRHQSLRHRRLCHSRWAHRI
jgi:outer membrane receptor protein involved in Fe transport